MRLVSIQNCKPGMKLGKPIFEENGRLLLRENVELTESYIERLKEQGISCLYILDKVTEDITIEEPIPLEMRNQVIQKLKTVFGGIQNGQHKWKGAVSPDIKASLFRDVLKMLIGEMSQRQSVMSLLTSIHVKDSYVFTHSLNVTLYTLAMAMKANWGESQLMEIGIGALLHDVGKMMLPQEVLHKPGKLTPDEFEMIKKHTEYGFDLLRKQYDISLLSAHCAFQHHEKWNGTGYPRGLKEEEIHPYARLMAVADVFDALTSHRTYRKALLPHEAVEIIYAGTNSHFEQQAVELFRQSISIYPIGITVKLSTGETAVVVDYNANCLSRPIVRVFKNPQGEEITDYYEIDLSKQLSIMITECEAIL